ncbi:HlyD family secretion protein [Steroidobacter sp. S1-65]|uniref:HlyD family secretion protein n=1 Tax=Steroidobacter gossypii TaxID=2805490 RepID=A0ABS1X0R7_9GAMM|nr:HlyD family secretion protein [Steroidobacter gossypii]MBM0106806.1 HlyD family secretion protein [Steroidobacter gossypii]
MTVKRLTTAGGVVIGAALVIFFGYALWHGVTPFEQTDNAYIKGDLTFVSTKVPGYVSEVLTENNQRVEPGQVLARIDPRDFEAARRDAEASVAQQRAALIQIDAQERLQQSQIRVADAAVASASAQLRRAEEEFVRASALVEEGGVSRSIYDAAAAEHVRARAAVDQATAQAKFARNQLDVIAAQREPVWAAMHGAEAKLFRARNDLEATTIRAPREGLIAGRNVRVGEFVIASARLMAVAPTQDLWVEAHLRETQISRVRPGDRVRIEVDAVRDLAYCGSVESVSGASGSEFALLPPDNATGNFTKIVRRFTVRILLDPAQPGLERLAGGMSAQPMIAIGSHADGRAHRGVLGWFSGAFGCELPKSDLAEEAADEDTVS